MQMTTSNQDSIFDMPRPFIRKNMHMAYDNVITCHHENISGLTPRIYQSWNVKAVENISRV